MRKSVVAVILVVVMLVSLVVLYYETNQQERLLFSLEQKRQQEETELALQKEVIVKEEKVNTDSLDWMAALMENTSDAYRQYLENHINGAHAEDAREMLEVFGRTRIVMANDSNNSVAVNSDSLQQHITRETTLAKENENVEPCLEPDTIH